MIWTGKAVYPTTAHVATGAAVLGTAFFLSLRAHRHLRAHPDQRHAAPGGLVSTSAVPAERTTASDYLELTSRASR